MPSVHTVLEKLRHAENGEKLFFSLTEFCEEEKAFLSGEEIVSVCREKSLQLFLEIAESAAKQAKRNVIPEVCAPVSFGKMLEEAAKLDLFIVPYENTHGMAGTKEVLAGLKKGMSVGVLIGPEGGFERDEIEKALAAGGKTISLGARILRTETAAIAAVGMIGFTLETKED